MPSFWIEFDQNGSRQQRNFESNSVTFGREQGVDFPINSPTVSRQHATIMFDPRSGYILRVLSRGGMTAVNGAPVAGDVQLQDGAVVNLGQFSFLFRAPQAQAQPQSNFGSGGFGGQLNSGGFGAQAPQQQPANQGGFGAQAPANQGKPAAAKPAAGSTVWDEIAASAEAQEDDGPRELTDFQKMQEAEKRADKGGPSPILLGVTAIAVLGVLGMVFLGGGDEVTDNGPATQEEQAEFQVNISCVGQDDCVEQAKQSYKIGVQLLEKKDANVTNLFDGYKKLYESKEYLAKGKAPAPAEMAQLEAKISSTRGELDAIFRNYRVVYATGAQRKMYKEMADALGAIKTYFPDQTSREYKFANEKEIEMKSNGTYPTRVE